MPIYNTYPLVDTIAQDDILLIHQTASDALKTVTKETFDASIQSGGGSGSGSFISIADYGAAADGSTEDAGAFNAAMEAAADLGGGTVFVPRGIYRVSGILGQRIQPRSNITLWFEPGCAINTGVPATNSTVIDINTGIHSNIENVRIIGNGLSITGSLSSSAVCYGIQATIIAAGQTISDVVIDGVNCYGMKTDGFTVSYNAGTPKPERIVVSNSFFTGNYRHGASVVGGRHITFVNCVFTDSIGDPLATGVDLEPDSGLEVSDIAVINCRFEGNDTGGLSVQTGAGTINRVRVVNCSAEDNTGYGFNFTLTDSVVVSNCTAHNNGTFGFGVLSCNPITISGCTSTSNGTRGFSVVNSPTAQVIGCSASHNSGSGFVNLSDNYITDGGAVFSACSSDYNSDRGIHVSFGYGASIIGCNVSKNWNDGINLASSSGCTVSGNTVVENGRSSDLNGDNIILETSHANNVNNNTVRQSWRFLHGTAAAGASTTITLPATGHPNDDFYNGYTVRILSGTGSGQSKTISDYNGTTKVATVSSSWGTNPDGTSVFEIAAAVRPRYGIRINGDCVDNKVTDNDLYYGGANGGLSDAGSGTVTSSGNRT